MYRLLSSRMQLLVALALCAAALNLSPGLGRAQSDDEAALVAGNAAFAFDLYHALAEDAGNLFYSPYSISLALAMTYAGARGDTEAQMASTLHFTLPQEALHPAFAALGENLLPAPENLAEDERLTLHVANALWVQAGFPFEAAYLDLLDAFYSAGLTPLDFLTAPEEARQVINDWVAEQTEDRIQDLLPPGSIDTLTRLVLTNAIYFNATWAHQFEAFATADEPFTLLDGSQVDVPMMHQTASFAYAAGDGYQAIGLPYVGGQGEMLIILPDVGRFDEIEAQLDGDFYLSLIDAMPLTSLDLAMLRWEHESEFSLGRALGALGMAAAFDPAQADFSGMADLADENLYISAVVHKAFVSVDENGTEAAAATGVVMGVTSMPMADVQVRIDRPFIYAIVDGSTGTILFLGRVLDPA
ncbi:MAG: serpin family protein [Anaerolineae bacterium]|nr:serpin family protein [Anaerolineae bacterium]